MALFDLVVRHGTVVDGSGGAPFTGDVALRGGRIVAVGTVAGKGAEEIDATGLIVTPGFVDIHTHYDGQITWDERLAPSSDHGVTTVVMGNCGVGFAPMRAHQSQIAIEMMEGVEDIPGIVMAEGVPFDLETFPEYLDALDKRRADMDFCAQLPHSPLRVYVMGERGIDQPATDRDLAEVRRLVEEALDAGALGVSTSRSWAHRFRDGRPAPSVNSLESELLALAGGLRGAGKGVLQVTADINVPAAKEFALLRQMAEAAGRPLSFTLMAGAGMGDWRVHLDGIRRAAADGLAIRLTAREAALAVGLADRGLLVEGYKADLNIIDFDRLATRAPKVIHDLPANGRRLVQKAVGFVATIVSGEVTYRNGEPTGKLPGRLVRGAQTEPAPRE